MNNLKLLISIAILISTTVSSFAQCDYIFEGVSPAFEFSIPSGVTVTSVKVKINNYTYGGYIHSRIRSFQDLATVQFDRDGEYEVLTSSITGPSIQDLQIESGIDSQCGYPGDSVKFDWQVVITATGTVGTTINYSGPLTDNLAIPDNLGSVYNGTNLVSGSIDKELTGPGIAVYPDGDNDGYGDAFASPILSCNQYCPFPGSTNNLDCNDSDASINPEQTEVPYNGWDDDCDPSTLDDDLDGDGFIAALDCDDTDASINTDCDNSQSPDVYDQSIIVCETAMSSGTAQFNLTNLNTAVDGGAGNTVSWYEDVDLNIPISDPTNVAVKDGDIFYVKVDDGTSYNVATASFTVNAIDDASFSYSSMTFCQKDNNPFPIINTPGGTFSADSGLVIDAATGEIDLYASSTGTYTVTYTINGACPASSSFDVIIEDILLPPTEITASNPTSVGFDLSWNAVVNASSYTIEIGNYDFTDIQATVTTADTNGTITSLQERDSYYYRIRTNNNCGQSQVSNSQYYYTIASPEGKAKDSLALVALYHATDGNNWRRNDNWLTGPVANWYGVSMMYERVGSVVLGSNNLTGSIPSEIGNLDRVYWLGLRGNNLQGGIPAEIGNMTKLGQLDLSYNQLSGSAPSELLQLNLDSLALNHNQFTDIPDIVGNMPDLWILYYDHNQLTFEDVLPNIDNSQNNSIGYAPQAPIGQDTVIYKTEGKSFVINLDIDENISDNQYIWFKNSVAIDTTNSNSYALSNITKSDEGIYTCQITNPAVPDLTLYSHAYTLIVSKHPQSITFSSVQDKVYGDAPFALHAIASSGLPVSFEIVEGQDIISLQDSTVTILKAGQATIRAVQAGNEEYEAAEPVSISFTIHKASQTIAFEALVDKTLEDDPITLQASASSGLEVAYSASGPVVLEGNILSLLDTGLVTVTASQAGNENYLQAEDVIQSFYIHGAEEPQEPEDSSVVETHFSLALEIVTFNQGTIPAFAATLYQKVNNQFKVVTEQEIYGTSSLSFNELLEGEYTVGIQPFDTTFLPAYLGNQLMLLEAKTIILSQDTLQYISLFDKPVIKSVGESVISGVLLRSTDASNGRILAGSTTTTGEVLANISVYLMHPETQEILAYAVSDQQGKFTFTGLQAGEYLFAADCEGLPGDEQQNIIHITTDFETMTITAIAGENIRVTEVQTEKQITAVEEAVSLHAVQYFPNPVADEIFIDLVSSWIKGEISVSDASGKVLKTQKITSKVTKINLEKMSRGIYIITLSKGNDHHAFKIFKQ